MHWKLGGLGHPVRRGVLVMSPERVPNESFVLQVEAADGLEKSGRIHLAPFCIQRQLPAFNVLVRLLQRCNGSPSSNGETERKLATLG